jgi:hypothetical protein
LKFTVPEGVPPGPETVAVRVVERATLVGEGEAESAVELAAALTVREREPVEPE